MKKIVVTVAPVSHNVVNEKEECTPEVVAEESLACLAAGASAVHLHVRDEKGNLTHELKEFSKTLDLIYEHEKPIIQASTGGVSDLSLDERCTAIKDSRVDLASLNMGSINFGDIVYINTLPDIKYWASKMNESNVHPELEVFCPAMIETSIELINEGILKPDVYFNFSLGIPGTFAPTVKNLQVMIDCLPVRKRFGFVHSNMQDFSVLAAAIAAGATGVRVGFEDSFYYAPNKRASCNVEIVERLCKLIKMLGFEVATIDEAREILLG